MTGRLIVDKKPQNAYTNMAIDYVLLNGCRVPTLRIYSWKPPAVSIGRFQSLEDEVDIDFCHKNNIDYVRRITGGGAVFHDQEVTYSFCIPINNTFFTPDLHKSYHFICKAVIKGLAKIGITAEYKPINDLVVNNKKISGCAQTRKKKIILQHGTVILNLDINKMFRVLKVSKVKISDKQIADVKQRVTSIKDELKTEISTYEVINALTFGFEETFSMNFNPSTLSPQENRLKNKFKKEIFTKHEWLYEK